MKTKRLIAMLLAMSMLLTLLAGCGKKNDEKPENTPEPTQRPQYELTDAAVNKEETVYINVSPDGEVKKVSVTDRLHTDMPQVRIEDKSNLSGIQDVKTFSEPVKDNDKLYWDMDNAPPMKISVSYTLDGKEIKGSSCRKKRRCYDKDKRAEHA